jgi:hypothetical protein
MLFDLCRNGQSTIDGGSAVAFFKKSGLTNEQLREVWNLSSYNKQRYLDQNEFLMFVLYIQQIQSKQKLIPLEECNYMDIWGWPLAKFEGI